MNNERGDTFAPFSHRQCILSLPSLSPHVWWEKGLDNREYRHFGFYGFVFAQYLWHSLLCCSFFFPPLLFPSSSCFVSFPTFACHVKFVLKLVFSSVCIYFASFPMCWKRGGTAKRIHYLSAFHESFAYIASFANFCFILIFISLLPLP